MEPLLKKFESIKCKTLSYPSESILPSIDDFSFTEIVNFVDEIKHEHLKGVEEAAENIDSSKKISGHGGSGDNSDA
jgi:hypothetical protein